MSAVVEKRKAFLINIAYIAFFIAMFFLFMKYIFGTVAPLLFAFVIALLLQRPVNFIVNKTPLKRGIVSTLLSLLCFSVIIAFFILIGVKIGVEVKNFISSIAAKFENLNNLAAQLQDWVLNLAVVQKLPSGIRESITSVIGDVISKLSSDSSAAITQSSITKGFDFSLLSTPLSSVWSTAKQIPSILIGFVISIVATCFMTADYPKVRSFIYRQLEPSRREKLSKAKHILVKSVGKLVKAYSLIVLITTVELVVGLEILTLCKVYPGEYILLLSVIIALIDIVPVLGTGTVLIPWAVYSIIMGRIGLGVGLLIVYVVILVIRQIIEPKLVAGQVDMSPIVTISAMYLGTKFLGVLGIFILPFVCITIKLLNDEGVIHIFKK